LTEEEKREGRREKLKIELPFEDAVRAALAVKPPSKTSPDYSSDEPEASGSSERAPRKRGGS
jgi:hypothetical protein